jgi:REP element-mobilizing transposase RayT
MEIQKYRKHLPHILVPGSAYFLTFRLSGKQARQLAPAEREAVIDHIGCVAPGNCLAWVVMPDHVHLLYQSHKDEDLRRTLKGLKGASARTLTTRFGRSAPVWQAETFDRIVRDERELQETWKYLEHNPVRKDLAAKPGEYPWSSAYQRR